MATKKKDMAEKYIRKWHAEPSEAIQWTGKNDAEVFGFVGKELVLTADRGSGIAVVTNDIGRPLAAKAGDYIAKDTQGYPFVFDKEHFERLYKKVSV